VTPDGREEAIDAPANVYLSPRISPDGKGVALTLPGSNTDIWIWDIAGKTMNRLTFDAGVDGWALWTRDGRRIAYEWTDTHGKYMLYWKSADGTGKIEPVGPDRACVPSSWSRDGKTLVLTEFVGAAPLQYDIETLSMEGERTRKPLLQEKYNEKQPRISRDGRWMAYTSDESGRNLVCVRPFPKVKEGEWQISTEGGDSPLWSPDGRELFSLLCLIEFKSRQL
jgi:Tol biopolymer transport system component